MVGGLHVAWCFVGCLLVVVFIWRMITDKFCDFVGLRLYFVGLV